MARNVQLSGFDHVGQEAPIASMSLSGAVKLTQKSVRVLDTLRRLILEHIASELAKGHLHLDARALAARAFSIETAQFERLLFAMTVGPWTQQLLSIDEAPVGWSLIDVLAQFPENGDRCANLLCQLIFTRDNTGGNVSGSGSLGRVAALQNVAGWLALPAGVDVVANGLSRDQLHRCGILHDLMRHAGTEPDEITNLVGAAAPGVFVDPDSIAASMELAEAVALKKPARIARILDASAAALATKSLVAGLLVVEKRSSHTIKPETLVQWVSTRLALEHDERALADLAALTIAWLAKLNLPLPTEPPLVDWFRKACDERSALLCLDRVVAAGRIDALIEMFGYRESDTPDWTIIGTDSVRAGFQRYVEALTKEGRAPGEAALDYYTLLLQAFSDGAMKTSEAVALRAADRLIAVGRQDLALGVAKTFDASGTPKLADKLQGFIARFAPLPEAKSTSNVTPLFRGHGEIPAFLPVDGIRLPGNNAGPGLRGENVSIVLLSQNRLRLTMRFLRSLAASIPDFAGEVLIFDNASDAGVVEFIEQYALTSATRLRVVKSQVNLGVGPGRNAAFKAASKPWVLSIDNDMLCLADPFPDADRVHSTLGTKYINIPFVNQTDLTSYGAGKSWFVVKSEAGDYVQHGNAVELSLDLVGDRHASGFISNRVSGGAALYHVADFFERGGFDAAMKIGYEDTEFSIRLSRSGTFVGNVARPYFFHAHIEATSIEDLESERQRFDQTTLTASAARMQDVVGLPVGRPASAAPAPLHKRARSSKSVYFASSHGVASGRKVVAVVLPYLPGPMQNAMVEVLASIGAKYEVHVFYRHEFATGLRLLLNLSFADLIALPDENCDLFSVPDRIGPFLALAVPRHLAPTVLVVGDAGPSDANAFGRQLRVLGECTVLECRTDTILRAVNQALEPSGPTADLSTPFSATPPPVAPKSVKVNSRGEYDQAREAIRLAVEVRDWTAAGLALATVIDTPFIQTASQAELLRFAQAAQRNGDWETAIALAGRVSEAGRLSRALLIQARGWAELREFDAALALLGQVQALGPHPEIALIALVAVKACQRWDGALAAFTAHGVPWSRLTDVAGVMAAMAKAGLRQDARMVMRLAKRNQLPISGTKRLYDMGFSLSNVHMKNALECRWATMLERAVVAGRVDMTSALNALTSRGWYLPAIRILAAGALNAYPLENILRLAERCAQRGLLNEVEYLMQHLRHVELSGSELARREDLERHLVQVGAHDGAGPHDVDSERPATRRLMRMVYRAGSIASAIEVSGIEVR